jgi:putative transposase
MAVPLRPERDGVAKPMKGTAMRKNFTEAVDRQGELVGVQIPLGLLASLEDVRTGFLSLCLSAGRQVLTAMMERDREALCGPKWIPNPQRRAQRAGTMQSEVTLGGRRIPITRLRARSIEGRELRLPSFGFAASRDPLDARTLEAIAVGVSTRKYHRSLDPLPIDQSERSVCRSSVSRRFVALSAQLLAKWMNQALDRLDIRVVIVDGIFLADHCILIALGVASDGAKHVLGLREGSSENSTVAKGLLSDLLDRGLSPERPILFVIDGGKGLRKAIGELFGPAAVVQRCQVHKRRNVLAHLPESMQPSVRRAMQQAYDTPDADLARRQLERLGRSLERDHPGAAGSLREGLEETLTLQRLGVTGGLYRTLRSTNPIENLNGSVMLYARNVRRWKDGTMILRWVGSALHEAQRQFRRLKGFRDMKRLVAALDRLNTNSGVELKKRVA